jgi:Ser/Thr protein kinase RdoA (MazF antagonist)
MAGAGRGLVTSSDIAAVIPDVLKSWNIVSDHITPISTKGNCHWRVQSGAGRFVLRKYRAGQSAATIRYELDILQRLRDRGWPVAPAIEDPVCHSGFMFALFPLLPGCPHERELIEQARIRGRILAELHAELGLLSNAGQRPAWVKADEISSSAMETPPPDDSDSARTIAHHLECVPKRLCEAGASSFPVSVVHGDFLGPNLLFQHEALSGILDFDSVHLDLRAADLACARRSRNDEVVRGYLDVARLAEAELECLHDLWRAAVLRYALQIYNGDLAVENREAELQWCVKQLEKTVPFDTGCVVG